MEHAFKDKRDDNLSIPLSLYLTLSTAAKMKLKTSVSGIPYAVTNEQTLAKLGYNRVDLANGLEGGLMQRKWFATSCTNIRSQRYQMIVLAIHLSLDQRVTGYISSKTYCIGSDCSNYKAKKVRRFLRLRIGGGLNLLNGNLKAAANFMCKGDTY
ncbi:MAG TPA: hypothetical protein VLH18_07380 [Candidatus Limnocylindrales bacterium]|nr:hypothetical protein [Candidatus Limnocylindrales bacterium]